MSEWFNRLTIGKVKSGNSYRLPVSRCRVFNFEPDNYYSGVLQFQPGNRLPGTWQLFHFLHINQLFIETVLSYQRIVCATFNDLAFL